MRRLWEALGISAVCLALGACSAIKAPNYQSSVDNVATLQGLGDVKVSVGAVKPNAANVAALNDVTIRGRSLESPYGDYAEYLKEALRTDLTTAGKYDQNAPHAVNAVLTRNRLDASGVNVGEAELAARFSVTNGARVVYDKEQTVKHEWESSFLGGIAIPRAVQNYATAVQKLLSRLFADPDFKGALNK
jgi:hypothetical protein